MPLDPTTAIAGAFEVISPNGSTQVADRVNQLSPVQFSWEFDLDFQALDSGEWRFRSVPNTIADQAGNRLVGMTAAGVLTVAIAVPPPTTNTAPGRVNTITEITFTPPSGYSFGDVLTPDTRIRTRILSDQGVEVGESVPTGTNSVSVPGIGTAGTWTLVHSGKYSTGEEWQLTETIEILPPVIPFTERLAVRLEGEFPDRLTLGNEHPPLDFTVVWASPAQDDPADDSQVDHATVVNAIALIDVATGARFWPDEPYLTIARNGRETTVTYRAARAFYAGTWALTALAGGAKDEAGRTLPEEVELARLTAVDYVAGTEQWNAANPPNPAYPRQAPASNNDLMGQIERVTTIRNLFDLNVDPQVNMSPETGMAAVEDMRITADGKFCVTAKVGLEQIWRLQVRHFGQKLTVDSEFVIDLGDHNGEVYLFFADNNGGEIPTVTYEGGLSTGSVAVRQIDASMVVFLSNNPTGSVTIKARSFDSWDFEGDKSTTEGDGSDRRICVKQSSAARYYSISARPRQSTTIYADGENVRIPVGRSYWDIEFRIDAGSVAEFKLFRDEVAVDAYPGNNFGWIHQRSGYERYAYRVYDLTGTFFATPTAVRVEITLDDGQVWTHSMTIEAAAFREPGIYPQGWTDGGSLPQYSTYTWQIGNADPTKTLTNVSSYSITPSGQGQGSSYGSSGSFAAAATFSETMNEPGQYGAIATWQYSDGTSDVHQVSVTSQAPPPTEPEDPYLFIPSGGRQLGRVANIFWASRELPIRAREAIALSVNDPDGGTANFTITPDQTSGTVDYVPRRIGTHQAQASIKYADWPSAVSTTVEFEAVIPDAPQNVSITALADGNLRIQWQEVGIAPGQDATRYILQYRVPDGTVSQQVWSSRPTENPQNNTYRYIEVQPWDRTLELAIIAEWNGVQALPSEYVAWVIYSDRTFAQMDAGASADLQNVANAIANGPQATPRAEAAGDAAFAGGNAGAAINAYMQTYSQNTVLYWNSVRDSTSNDNLRAVAAANGAWLYTPGQPGLIDALLQCVGNGIGQACGYADSTEALYLQYLSYAASKTADNIVSIQDWIAAGRPTT